MGENEILYVVGTGIPKPADNQNTDDILPARFMKEPSFTNMGKYVYYDERFKDEQPVVDHPFNDPRYSGGSILIAGANYGTGSSREHAPQGLYRFGIRGIIAESYADIFDANCANVGIVAVRFERSNLDILLKDVSFFPRTLIKIDLERRQINYTGSLGHLFLNFQIPEGTRQALMTGSWDALSVLQRNEGAIRQLEERLPYLVLR